MNHQPSPMRYAASESHAMWTWRHTTDQSMPFKEWQAQRDQQRAAWQSRPEYQAAQAAKRERNAAAHAKAQADYAAKRAAQGCTVIKCNSVDAAMAVIQKRIQAA